MSGEIKSSREKKIKEATKIIDAARQRGLTLRLIGGLAVREHCQIVSFCERDYSDIDTVALGKEVKKITELFKDMGYKENVNVRVESGGRRLQFYKDTPDNHIDIFIDTFEMEHDIELKNRLKIEKYTISLSDVLLTKLQIHKLNKKDVKDIITVIKDNKIGEEDKPGVVNVKYIAKLCAKNWGLYKDVTINIDKVASLINQCKLSEEEMQETLKKLKMIKDAIENEPKTLKWKLRAKIGEKKSWRDSVEDETR
ncbi:MAG: hypothetical protein ACTSSJ_05925 [Candidatus Odinarchaeia archaeon]